MELIEKPIRKVFTMKSYLENLQDEDIREDLAVQRAAGQYSYEMNNELVFTVLTDDYVPPLILGTSIDYITYIIDGLQRSTCFKLFRLGNYKITSSIKNSVVYYRAREEDEDGNVNMVIKEYNIIGKTYETLPRELQKKFDEYQIETVIHEKCTMERLFELARRYNNHKAMSVDQRSLCSIGTFAKKIKEITNMNFFINCGSYSEKDKINGKMERIIMESVMCSNHFENWKSSPNKIATYLDNNANINEFNGLKENLERLENIVSDKFKNIFDTKNSFIWFTLFNTFTKLGIDDGKFTDFLRAFNDGLRAKEVNGKTFDTLDNRKGTKDKKVVSEKLTLLEVLMYEFLHINIEETPLENIDSLSFVQENVSSDITSEDMDFYNDILLDLSLNVDNSSKLLDNQNELSMLAIVAYGCQNDIDLDDWFITYFDKNNTYLASQKENYLHMKQDLNQWIAQKERLLA